MINKWKIFTIYILILFVIAIGFSACKSIENESAEKNEFEPSNATQTIAPENPPVENDQPDHYETADIIFHNGNLITIDPGQPLAEAMAIHDGLIQAIGTDQEVLKYQGDGTEMIDLQGMTLMPGFIDGHTHILTFHDRLRKNLEDAQETALQYGFTSVNEMWANEDIVNKFLEAENDNSLRLRVNVFPIYNEAVLDGNRKSKLVETWYPENAPILDSGRLVRIPGIKVFVDGDGASYERGCWALSEPFEAGESILSRGVCGTIKGDLYWDQDELNQVVKKAQEAGFRVAFHAMGDQAIETTLNAIEFALGGTANAKVRHQIEHNSMIRPDQLERYEELDVIASVRGYGGAWCDLESLTTPFGEDRYLWYVNRYALPNLDIHAYIETDFGWTVDPDERFVVRGTDPIMQLYGIVTNKYVMPDGSICEPSPLGSIQPISIERALQMLTIEPAYAVSIEDVTGSLTPGKFADVIILSEDPLSVEPDNLKELKVFMTMVGGKVEYCDPGLKAYCPGPTAPMAETREDTLPFGYIDFPSPNQTLSGVLNIEGWSLDNDGLIDRVEIYIDDKNIGKAEYGNARPDVASDYPGREGSPDFGFSYQLDTSELGNGPHTLSVRAIGPAGDEGSLIPEVLNFTIEN